MKAVFAALALGMAGVSTAAPLTNEDLFDLCRVAQRIGDSSNATEVERLQGIRCLAYLGGAVQVYAFTNLQCKMDTKTILQVVEDYVDYTRATGEMKQPAALVVHSLLDDCYCSQQQAPAFKRICPAPLPPR